MMVGTEKPAQLAQYTQQAGSLLMLRSSISPH